MIDTHAHLNLDPLVTSLPTYLQNAKEAGVTDFIIPGVNLESSKTAITIASTYPHCYAAIGFHPDEADTLLTDGTNFDHLKSWITSNAANSQIVALGECGLDYYRLPENPQRRHTQKAQHQLFKFHLHLATTLDIPLIIHVRDAHTDALHLLSTYKPKGVLHCFSGDIAYLNSALKLGLYVSFAGNLTFQNATQLQHLLPHVPLDRLLLETDAPYLNPHRGHWPNHPANIKLTYQLAAQLLNLSVEKLEAQISQNAKRLFRI